MKAADIVHRLRTSAIPPSPLVIGGAGLAAGTLGLAVAVLAALSGSGRAWLGPPALLALLAVHAMLLLRFLRGGGVSRWAVGAQALLTYLPLPLLGGAWTPVSGLLAGGLLLAAGRTGYAVPVALALVCGPAMLAVPGGNADPFWAFAAPLAGFLEYVIVHLSVRADRLDAARAEAVSKAVSVERRRFTRDLHDLVGHRLTVLVLKLELIQRLLKDGDEKAGTEADETLTLARNLSADVRAVAHGTRTSSLETELSSARALLESVGVRCQVRVSCRELPGERAEALTHALREGVTNVLRHAKARACVIQLLERGGVVSLSIRNDGAERFSRSGSAGHGLGNLAERVSVLGGWLEASAASGTFVFTVSLPRN